MSAVQSFSSFLGQVHLSGADLFENGCVGNLTHDVSSKRKVPTHHKRLNLVPLPTATQCIGHINADQSHLPEAAAPPKLQRHPSKDADRAVHVWSCRPQRHLCLSKARVAVLCWNNVERYHCIDELKRKYPQTCIATVWVFARLLHNSKNLCHRK